MRSTQSHNQVRMTGASDRVNSIVALAVFGISGAGWLLILVDMVCLVYLFMYWKQNRGGRADDEYANGEGLAGSDKEGLRQGEHVHIDAEASLGRTALGEPEAESVPLAHEAKPTGDIRAPTAAPLQVLNQDRLIEQCGVELAFSQASEVCQNLPAMLSHVNNMLEDGNLYAVQHLANSMHQMLKDLGAEVLADTCRELADCCLHRDVQKASTMVKRIREDRANLQAALEAAFQVKAA